MRELTTREDFDSAIANTEADYVLAIFTAPWCGPCKAMAPILAQLDELHNHVEFIKVNVDEAQELAVAHGIQSVPQYRLFKRGDYDAVAKIRGAQNRAVFEDWLLQSTPVDVPPVPTNQTLGLEGANIKLNPNYGRINRAL